MPLAFSGTGASFSILNSMSQPTKNGRDNFHYRRKAVRMRYMFEEQSYLPRPTGEGGGGRLVSHESRSNGSCRRGFLDPIKCLDNEMKCIISLRKPENIGHYLSQSVNFSLCPTMFYCGYVCHGCYETRVRIFHRIWTNMSIFISI